MSFIVKDHGGRTIENVTSLNFGIAMSDDSLLKCQEHPCPIYQKGKESSVLDTVLVPSQTTVKLYPQGSKGDVDVQISILGYRNEVLKSVGVEMPRPLSPP